MTREFDEEIIAKVDDPELQRKLFELLDYHRETRARARMEELLRRRAGFDVFRDPEVKQFLLRLTDQISTAERIHEPVTWQHDFKGVSKSITVRPPAKGWTVSFDENSEEEICMPNEQLLDWIFREFEGQAGL